MIAVPSKFKLTLLVISTNADNIGFADEVEDLLESTSCEDIDELQLGFAGL